MKDLKLLSRAALSFQDLEYFDKDMNKILKDIGQLIDISRIYIILHKYKNPENTEVEWTNKFEWCSEGVSSQIENLKTIKYEDVPSWKDQFKHGFLYVDYTMNLPKDISKILYEQDIKSLAAYPLKIENEIIGYIGFDECREIRIWTEEELVLLSTLAGILSKSYERKRNHQEVVDSESNFRSIFESNPIPMSINDISDRRFINLNPALLEKTGYEESDLIGKTVYESNIFLETEKLNIIGQRIKNGETIKNEELIFISKSGKLLTGLFSIETIKSGGRSFFLAVAIDITQIKELTKELEYKCQKLNQIIEASNLGTWEWNIENGDGVFNTNLPEMLGYTLEELGPINIDIWNQMLFKEDAKKAQEELDKHLKGEIDYYDCEIRLINKAGELVWIRDRGKVIEWDSSGKPLTMFGTHSNITAAKQQSLELERFFAVSSDLFCIMDKEGRFVKVNKVWDEILGYPGKELIGKNFSNIIGDNDFEATSKVFKNVIEGNKKDGFISKYKDSAGEDRYMEWKGDIFEGLVYSTARDVTERIIYEKKILQLSHKDTLTNIYNRRYVYDRSIDIIEEFKRDDKEFSVCIIDIDNFKDINDKYGHGVGDSILKQFTKIIGKNLRLYDVFGRYGGEEFIVILKKSTIKESVVAMHRILNIVRDKVFLCRDQEIRLTFSAGIASCKEVKKENLIIDELIEIADRRMYGAKNLGKNKICCS